MNILNLGCGNDVREGANVINIDIKPSSPAVKRGDFRNLDFLGIEDNSCDTIWAINIINCLTIKEIGDVLNMWKRKLAQGGSLHIDAIDSNLIGLAMNNESISLDDINNLIFDGDGNHGLYNLPSIEHACKQLALKVVQKGYRGLSFYLEVAK